MAHIYRDTVSADRILIPIEDANETDWTKTLVEIWRRDNRLDCREIHLPSTILERYYKKEEL
jgi:hypothetical protein